MSALTPELSNKQAALKEINIEGCLFLMLVPICKFIAGSPELTSTVYQAYSINHEFRLTGQGLATNRAAQNVERDERQFCGGEWDGHAFGLEGGAGRL